MPWSTATAGGRRSPRAATRERDQAHRTAPTCSSSATAPPSGAGTGRHTGITDLPLLPEGEEQAHATAQLVAGQEFALVLTSPLQRARPRLRELVGLGDQAEVDDDLREFDYGTYEGVTTATIRETVPGWTV